MDRGFGNAGWLLGGAVVGWAAARWSGYGYGAYGGYPAAYPPAPYAYGYGYGHGGHHGCHDRCDPMTERRLACLEAENAANAVAIKKDEKIAHLEDKIVKEDLEGKIYRATCMKPDGRVYLSPDHLANAYRGETRVIDSHPVGYGQQGFFNGGCHW